jgi:hypothetical protein
MMKLRHALLTSSLKIASGVAVMIVSISDFFMAWFPLLIVVVD